jgi:hypothetical protein
MEPVRLRDLDGGDPVMRDDLVRSAAQDVGYDVAAGAARFEAGLAAGLPLPADPASVSGGGLGALAWWGIGSGIAGVVAITWAVGGPPREKADATAPVVVQQVRGDEAPEPVRPPAIVVPPAIVDTPIIDTPVVEPAPKPVRKTEPRKATVPARDDDRLQREMAATRAADKALAADPSRALELVRAADREFTGGMFAEDREGIAALAKLRLGKGDAAARVYVSAHPKGSYAERLRRALDEAQGE